MPVRSVTIAIAGIFFLSAATALGQTARTKPQAQSSIGFIVPVYFNPQLNSGQDRSDSGRRTALGGWGELIAFASPLLAFHTGFEFPTATSTNVRHFGSAGFESAVSRPSIMGGIEVPVNLSDELALVAELRGRVALRKGLGFPFDEMFGRFSLTPGVGVRFHWTH